MIMINLYYAFTLCHTLWSILLAFSQCVLQMVQWSKCYYYHLHFTGEKPRTEHLINLLLVVLLFIKMPQERDYASQFETVTERGK